MKRPRLLALSLLTAVGCASHKKAPVKYEPLDLSALMKADTSEGLQRAAKQLRDRAKQSEDKKLRDINERMARFIEQRLIPLSQSPEANLKQADLDELASIMRDVAKAQSAPGAWKPQYELANNLGGLASLADGLKLNGKLFRSEAREISDNLIKDHPKLAEAYLLKANLYVGPLEAAQEEARATRIEALVKCLELNAKQESCRKQLGSLAAELTAPFCVGSGLKSNFAVYRCPVNGGKKLTKVFRTDGSPYRCMSHPLLTPADIATVSASDDKLPGLGAESAQVSIDLNSEAIEKVAQASRDATDTTSGEIWVAALGSKVLAAPHVRSPIDQGRLQLSMGLQSELTSEALLGSLCRKVERPELPPDVERLLKGSSESTTSSQHR